MNKKWWILGVVGIIIIVVSLLSLNFLKKKEIPIDNSGFTLLDNMTVEVYSDTNISSKIQFMNGTLEDDKKIDTNHLGSQTIEFLYKDSKGKNKKGAIAIEVVDTTAPIVLLSNAYTVTVGYSNNLTDIILSADNYDKNPKREIIGDYDLNQIGSYNVIYRVTDQSGNATDVEFTLYVKEKSNTTYEATYTDFQDVIATYKNESNKIGIDISKWQGNIDFDMVKSSGAEFVIIRVGTGLGFGEESLEDPYFKQNIQESIAINLPVGIYYYSYATTREEAKEEAQWVIDRIKDYPIDLPIVFDWESWSYFNGLNLSLHDINEVATAFLEEIEKYGYRGMLYGSKNYLQKIWTTTYPVWLAHYTSKTNYEGDYLLWQLCENGKIDGINGYVDINILYNK